MKNSSTPFPSRSRGSALLIVLAFLLLLSILTIGFLSRALFERQLSNASFSQGKVGLSGQGAVAAIIGDLQEEIMAGSNGTGNASVSGTLPALASGYYYPNAPATVIPAISGFTSTVSGTTTPGLENLIAISGTAAFYSGKYYDTTDYPAPNRASSVATTTPSLNGRSITPARWNAPLLLAPNSSSDYTPYSSNFVVPNWIYVARDGSNPGHGGTSTLDPSYIFSPNVAPTTTSSTGTLGTNAVTQRYAYAIYDEGSTLDLNEAGSPMVTGTYSSMEPYKNALAYADLTQLPAVSSLSATGQQAFVNAIVGWRNFATAKLSSANAFPNYSSSSISTTQANAFDQYLMFNTSGFLTVTTSGTSTWYGPQNGAYHPNQKNQTDNAFVSRQQLLQFFLLNLGQNTTFAGQGSSTGGTSGLSTDNLASLLPYFGTFSRDLSQPSYAPDPSRPVVLAAINGGNDMAGQAYTTAGQNIVNPAFLDVTITSTFTRNDGTTAVVGEPLVKKRFALNRLAWLTYRGPSADRTWPLSATASNPNDKDYDLYVLVNIYGIPASFLQLGTDANIGKYFGLAWGQDTSTTGTTTLNGISYPNFAGINDGTYKWKYEHGTAGSGLTTSGSPRPIMTLTGSNSVLSALREPDFFELLKAAVTVGAIAKPATLSGTFISTGTGTLAATVSGYSNRKDSSVDAYIIQLGANIIAQSNPANYCPRIIFDDGVTFKSGTTNYPQEYRGIEDLPYLYQTRCQWIKTVETVTGTLETNDGQVQIGAKTAPYTAVTKDPGGQGYLLEVPVIWCPHAWNPATTTGTVTGISPLGNGSAASPEFQIVMLSSDPNNYSLGPSNPAFCARPSYVNTSSSIDGAAMTGTQSWNLTGTNSWIRFSMTSPGGGGGYLSYFREPTLLDKPDPGANSTYAGPPYGTYVTSSISNLTGTLNFTGTITSCYQSAAYTSGTDNQHYLGFALAPTGTATLSSLWIHGTPSGGLGLPAGYYQIAGFGDWNGHLNGTTTSQTGNYDFTYRLQYKDAISGSFVTYDEKFLPLAVPDEGTKPVTNPFLGKLLEGGGTISSPTTPWKSATANYASSASDPSGSYCYAGTADPRANRWSSDVEAADFCAGQQNGGAQWVPPPIPAATNTAWTGWIDQSVNAVVTGAPDYSLGWPAVCSSSAMGFNLAGNAYMTAGVPAVNTTTFGGNNGKYSGDTSGTFSTSQYYADPDGVVRRGTAGYLTSASTPSQPYGLPLATSTTLSGTSTGTPIVANNGNRPVILHRPFRTVAELGYTFSGTPGKNIDFATPESGYSALLDVFCINDTNDPGGLVAGKVNVNTRQAAVLEAILSKAYKDELSSYFGATLSTTFTSSEASAVITDSTYGLLQRTLSSNATTGQGPLRNISELVGKFVSANYTSTNKVQTSPPAYQGYNATTPTSSLYSGFSGDMNSVTTTTTGSLTMLSSAPPMNVVQRFHEAAIRALAANTTSRVWNLMIDVIAQNGRFPNSATSLANFNVEGERRYWVHVAIDRYTGKVLDEQVEEVKE